MAVPKEKVSKARKHSRNSNNYKVAAPTLVECPACHAKKVPHQVCPKCGMYDGKQRIEIKKEEK
ncbi:MAG: 50S ribosomal protein L32 [Clostridia bacterium]